MKTKRVISLLTCLAIAVVLQLPVLAAGSVSSVYVNNIPLGQGILSADANGAVYAAASEYAQALGGTFTFKADSMAGTIMAGGHELTYYLDGKAATLDGKNVQAAQTIQIIGNRFMIPVAFTADKLGGTSVVDAGRNALMVFDPTDGRLIYSVLPGDTLWKISMVFSTTISQLRQNNGLSGDMLTIGQKLFVRQLALLKPGIAAGVTASATVFSGASFSQPAKGYLPAGASVSVQGKAGDWYSVDTKFGPGYVYRTVISIPQDVSLSPKSTYFGGAIPVDTGRDSVTYDSYTVVRGDSVWFISQKSGVTENELAAANSITPSTMLYPGQILRLPVHHVALPVLSPAPYGEVLDWFKQGQYVFPIGKVGKVMDPVTGKSFMVKRTMGASHSDTETLTASDTAMMKEIFGSAWTWNRKAFLLEVDGRRFAISISGMPHAGVDGVPLNQNVDNRSGGYGYGPNDDAIAGNGMDGHFDLYFLNALRHMDNRIDPDHQLTVLQAGGLR